MDLSGNKRSGEFPGILPPHGGYRDLKSYQMAEIMHDATGVFSASLIAALAPMTRWCRRHAPDKEIVEGRQT